jgi:hypothetical protein
VFCGFSFASCCATSRSAAEPLPLSLMPGPWSTESRWAPAMTTLSSLAPGSSAITFTWGRLSGGSTLTWAVDPGCASAAPSAKEAPTTGIAALLGASVPMISPSRTGVFPWLKITTASAPAA